MRDVKSYAVMTAKAANGVGSTIDVSGHRHVMLAIASASSANLTLKVQGSFGKDITVNGTTDDAPTFSSTKSKTNAWQYVNSVNLISNAVVAGGTGIPFAAADDVVYLEVNCNGLRFVNVELSSYVAGNVDVKAVIFNDED